MSSAAIARGLVYTTSANQRGRTENKKIIESHGPKIIKIGASVTNFG
jgi:hypothetical protein